MLQPLRIVKRALTLLTCLAFLLSFLKGTRMPGLWAATNLSFNYSQGFVRRGLVGEVLRRLGGEEVYSYNVLALVALALLAVAVATVSLLLRRVQRMQPDDLELRVAILVFAASPATVFFVHMVGYLDYVGAVAVPFLLLAARWLRDYGFFYATLGAGVVCVLVHESIAVMFAPVMLFAMLCHVFGRGEDAPAGWRRLELAHAVLFTGAILLASAAVGTIGTRPATVIKALETALAAHTDFPLRPDALEALRRSSLHLALRVMPAYYRRPGVAAEVLAQAFVMLPGYAFLLVYGLRSIAGLALSRRRRRLLLLAFLAASFSPLALHLVGWDHGRWNSLAVLATLFCVAALKLRPAVADPTGPAVHRRPSPVLLTCGAAAALLGLASEPILFDGRTVQLFPFEKLLESAVDLVQGGFRFVPEN